MSYLRIPEERDESAADIDLEIEKLLEEEDEMYAKEQRQTADSRQNEEASFSLNGALNGALNGGNAAGLGETSGCLGIYPPPALSSPPSANPIPNDIYTESDPIENQEIRISFNEQDGVFANMAAKPNLTVGKVYQELEPPSYHETIVDPAPDYIVNCVDEDGEILIEGMPMGNFVLFFVSMFISMTFDILGFFLTTLMAASHAARLGSQSGLGLTLMRYGVLLKSKAGQGLDNNDVYRGDPEEEKSRREWSAMFIFCMGLFVFIRAFIEYVRLRRTRAMIGSIPLPYGF